MYNINIPELLPETEDIIRLFFKDYKRGQSSDIFIDQEISFIGQEVQNKTIIGNQEFFDAEPFSYNKGSLEYFKYLKRFAKHSLYKALKHTTGLSMPWGSLTGIRPTKLAYELLENGVLQENISQELEKTFDISPKKLKLLSQIIEAQKGIYKKDEKAVNLYVNIPVCLTRCSYCSFISSELKKCEHLIGNYAELLSREIEYCLDLIKSLNLYIRSVYVGGGTPTSINIEQLDKILSAIPKDTLEFTVEAGRPDTITKEKLDLLKAHKVTRISINPQTFNQEVLNTIGRGHLVEDIYTAFELARNYDFIINMDLIAGLPSDDYSSFCDTIHKTLDLSPDNITAHTLSLKSGSTLKQRPLQYYADAVKMVDYAYEKLTQAGYTPYYLYRQKNMIGNLENTGYCKPGTQCINNIDTMEESVSVIACGAGAISKRLMGGGRIERSANVKFIEDYIARFDEMLSRHKQLFFDTK
ncbi:MAG TPA: coproporphyrinogen dehydrogenase HemZ [Clostridia bacterium]